MKKILYILSIVLVTTSLSSCNKNSDSEYCINNGGTIEIKTNEYGVEYEMCNLPDGTKLEEWNYGKEIPIK